MKKMNILFILITLILIFGTTNVYALNFDYKVKGGFRFFQNQFNNIVIINSDNNITSSSQYYNARQTLNFTNNFTNSYNYDFVRFDITSIAWTIQTNMQTNQQIEVKDYSYDVLLRATEGNWSKCQIENSFILCPLEKDKTYTALIFDNLKTQNFNSNIELHVNVFQSGDLIDYIGKSDTQSIIDNQNQNTQTIVNNITDNQINSSDTDTSNIISIPNSNGKNTILDLLMVPINFITSIINSFSNSCVSYNLGNMLGTDLILPCINLQNILGSGLYNIIDAIFAFGMIFAFIRSVKKFIQKALMLTSDVSSEVSIF